MKLHQIRNLLAAADDPVGLDEVVDELYDYDTRLRRILKRHLAHLSWWAGLNLLALALLLVLPIGRWYYFILMGFIWGIINGTIVLLLVTHTFLKKFRGGDHFGRILAQRHVEKMILFNVGFDLTYMAVGFWMRELSCRLAQPAGMWEGFGLAVVLQGLVLFALDLRTFLLLQKHFRNVLPFLKADLLRAAFSQDSKSPSDQTPV